MSAPIEDRGELGDRGELEAAPTKRSRLSWRRKPREAGLYGALYNGTRGWELRRGEECLARVVFSADGRLYWFTEKCDLWQRRNTAVEGLYFGSPEAAQAHCVDWVKARLSKEPR